MSDLPRLLAAYGDATDGFLATAREVAADPVRWRAATDCPGWTVGDIVAHIVGLEQDLAGRPRPEHDLPEGLDHVRNDVGRWMEVPVDYRRGVPAADVLAELMEIVPVRRSALATTVAAALAAGEDPVTPGPLGAPMPLSRLLRMRIFDVWTHEQDIRRAVALPGHLSGPAADVAAEQIRQSLPYVVARKAGLRPGNVVQLWADGQTSLHATVAVDSDGRGRLVEPGAQVGLPTVDISMGWETLVRLACGRATAEQVADEVDIDGSRKAGQAVLGNLAITP